MMPKVLILYLCALLYLTPTHSALLKDSSNADSATSSTFIPSLKHHSVEDMVSSILEDHTLPFVENVLTTTISPEEAKEHDKEIQQDVIVDIADSQDNQGSQNDIQNDQITKEVIQTDAPSTKHEDVQNTQDSQESTVLQSSSTVHQDIIEPHPNELSLEALHMCIAPECSVDNETCAMELGHSNEGESQENSFRRQFLQESSEEADAKNNIDAEVEEAQKETPNEILDSSGRLDKTLETTENLRSNSLESSNEKSEMGKLIKSDASEKSQEKTVENSQGNTSTPVGQSKQSAKPHSREIFVQTSQGDEYFHKGPIFILGVGIVIVIMLAFRMMTEQIDEKIQEYDEERDSLMTS